MSSSSSSSSEGAQSPSRRRNSTATTDDDPQYHFDSLQEKQAGVATAAASAPHTTTRRRSSRTTSGTKSSPRSASPPQTYSEDLNEGSDKKSSKPPRKTLKKLLRRDSHHTEIAPGSLQSGHEDVAEDEGSTVGYIPRLGQIRERKTTMQSRRRGSSIVSSSGQPRALRRRHTDDSTVSRLRAQRKHSSSSRHGGKLAQLSEPSSASSVSQQSSASSSGSNSTVTQKSREDHDYTYQYETFGERQRLAMQNSMINDTESEVFKYLQPANDGQSSVFTGSSQATSSVSLPLSSTDFSTVTGSNGSNVTLQASPSTQQPNIPTPHLPHQEFRKFKKPLYASSFVHGPADDDEETVNQSAESEQGSETEGEEETKGSNEPSSPKVETKAPPPRPQSTSSRGSDPHVRRLKQQERELANHILKNPKPQKQFQFSAVPGTPAQPYPPVPMYSPQVYSASPSVVGGTPTANPPWPPPMHTFPAPLAIGYAPHQSPEVAHAYPHSMVSQMPPPFSPHGSQPPRYQQHAPSSLNQTKYPMTGYELLAHELSATASSPDDSAPPASEIVPVYRKFEHLNHRVLLHLQDETSELEEELRQLDRCIAQMSPKDPSSGQAYPASRRNDARYGGDLHFKRTELLGRIFQKLEQYSEY